MAGEQWGGDLRANRKTAATCKVGEYMLSWADIQMSRILKVIEHGTVCDPVDLTVYIFRFIFNTQDVNTSRCLKYVMRDINQGI